MSEITGLSINDLTSKTHADTNDLFLLRGSDGLEHSYSFESLYEDIITNPENTLLAGKSLGNETNRVGDIFSSGNLKITGSITTGGTINIDSLTNFCVGTETLTPITSYMGVKKSADDYSAGNTYYVTSLASTQEGCTQDVIASSKVKVEVDTDGEATLSSDYVANAIWNDIADYINVEEGTEVIYGRVYTRSHLGRIKLAKEKESFIGIASDTCGFKLGKNKEENQIPIALGGWVLAYVDRTYRPGTLLKVGKEGILTKASLLDRIFHYDRMVAKFDRVELKTSWHGKKVDGRCWVKVI